MNAQELWDETRLEAARFIIDNHPGVLYYMVSRDGSYALFSTDEMSIVQLKQTVLRMRLAVDQIKKGAESDLSIVTVA